jgi:hypothetical protein
VKTINHAALTEEDRRTLVLSPQLAEQSAVLLTQTAFCRFAVARDQNLRPVSPLDPSAFYFSIEGAVARVREAKGLPFEIEAWIHRAYAALFGETCFVDNDRHSKETAADALRTCAEVLRAWIRAGERK